MDFVILKVNGQDVSRASHEDAVRAFQAAQEPIVVEVMRRAGAAPRGVKGDQQEAGGHAISDIRQQDGGEDEAGWVTAATQTEEWVWPASPEFPPPPPFDADDYEANVDNGYDVHLDQRLDFEEVTLNRGVASERLGLTLYYPDGDEAGEETDVLVRSVETAGIAATDGRILPGDQIIQINGEDVFNKEQAERLLASQCSVTLLVCRPSEQDDEECGLEPVGGEAVSAPDESGVRQQRLDNRAAGDEPPDGGGDSPALERRDTMRSGTSSSSSATSGSSGDCGSPAGRQGTAVFTADREISLLDEQMTNIQRECESLARRQRGMRRREIEDHIYETIPEASESDEPLYCHPYDPSQETNQTTVAPTRPQCDLAQWVRAATQRSESAWHQKMTINEALNNTERKAKPVQNGHKQVVNGSAPMALQPSSVAGEKGQELKPASVPKTRESSLQTCLDREGFSEVACRHCRKCMRLPPLQNLSNLESGSTKNKNVKNVINSSVNSSEKNRNYVTFLPQGTLYTNAANLEETMQRQQRQLYQQLLRRGHSRITPSGQAPLLPNPTTSLLPAAQLQQYYYVSSPNGSSRNHSFTLPTNRDSGQELQYQYKVKVRSDGSRYIARRPLRKQLLKERAARITEERTGITTDDDAMSELKLGRYWPRDEKKRQLEQAREKKLRLQQRPGQKMPVLTEEGAHEEHSFCRRQARNGGCGEPSPQRRTSTSSRRRNASDDTPKLSKPPKPADIVLSVTTV